VGMRRIIGPIVVIVGVIAALFTIATGIVYLCPSCNPLRPSAPDISGEWDGALAIITDSGPTGELHLLLREKTDGSFTGQMTLSPPLPSNNNGPVTVGAITSDNHVEFSVSNNAQTEILHFSGAHDNRDQRIAGIFYSTHGFNGFWSAVKSKGAALQGAPNATVISEYSPSSTTAHVIEGGIPLLVILLGLRLLSSADRKTSEAVV
jgi:hypothetical protein